VPEITQLGWFHTGIAIVALISGLYSLVRFRIIEWQQVTGRIYLVCTLVAAATALGIYQHGGFGPAHGLAVLTLIALLAGGLAERGRLFGRLSPYVQAMSYSGTFLFHMIPAITDGLMRLPVDSPIVTNPEDPLLRGFYLGFLVVYIIGVSAQMIWLRNQRSG
jgi:uncharacterized membrane protein